HTHRDKTTDRLFQNSRAVITCVRVVITHTHTYTHALCSTPFPSKPLTSATSPIKPPPHSHPSRLPPPSLPLLPLLLLTTPPPRNRSPPQPPPSSRPPTPTSLVCPLPFALSSSSSPCTHTQAEHFAF